MPLWQNQCCKEKRPNTSATFLYFFYRFLLYFWFKNISFIFISFLLVIYTWILFQISCSVKKLPGHQFFTSLSCILFVLYFHCSDLVSLYSVTNNKHNEYEFLLEATSLFPRELFIVLWFFHFLLISLGKTWIHLFFIQLCINIRAGWIL